jgi:hypothetical protein
MTVVLTQPATLSLWQNDFHVKMTTHLHPVTVPRLDLFDDVITKSELAYVVSSGGTIDE